MSLTYHITQRQALSLSLSLSHTHRERQREKLREMVSGLQKRLASRKKLHPLRSLASYKGKQSSMFLDTYLFIYKLKLKLEALEMEYSNLLAMKREYTNQEVKVDKIGDGFKVKVRCEKGEDKLVSILDAFEKTGLDVLQARVSCTNCFSMEAIVVAEDHRSLKVPDITQAISVAIAGKITAHNHHQETHKETAQV